VYTSYRSNLPPNLQPFASFLTPSLREVQETFQFLLATTMHEAGRFELLNLAEVDGQCRYTFWCSVRAKCRESD